MRLSSNTVFDLSSGLAQLYLRLLVRLSCFCNRVVHDYVAVDVCAADDIAGVLITL